MKKPAYTLIEFDGLDHLHIFEGDFTQTTPKIICNTKPKSCCGHIKQADYERVAYGFKCKQVKDALLACINSNKAICAACEEHLFKKYQEERHL